MPRHHPPCEKASVSQHGGAASADRLRRFLHVGHIFSSVVRDILEDRYIEEIGPESITSPQFRLLKLICLKKRHQLGHIADLLGVSSPAVCKCVDRLEGMGLVARNPSRSDRRVTLLSASPGGRRLVERYEELKAARLEPVLEAFSPEEIEAFSDFLARFSVNLVRREAVPSGFRLRCGAYGDADCPLADMHRDCPFRQGQGGGAPHPGIRLDRQHGLDTQL